MRLILDLSSPRGDAVNDGISQEDFACVYSKFDDAVNIIRHLGRGAFMAKVDIKHAFRICPVSPDQWPLLCYQWLDQFFIDTRLPFGSRSSPFIFNTFAMALAWIIINVGGLMFLIHYLDDFFMAHYSESVCQHDLDVFLSICSELGVPLADDKTVGPSTRVTYLGIEIDSSDMTIRLPSDKMEKIQLLLHTWKTKRKCTKQELLSLIGILSFACKVVKGGRMFLRRLIDLSTTVPSLHHHVYLNSEAQADIQWWLQFLPHWNGIAIIHPPPINSHELHLYTDASDVGLGGFYGNNWFSSAWRDDWKPSLTNHINARELFAVWTALFLWGDSWVNNEILIFTDNQAVVDVWLSGTCKDKLMMKLIRCMFFFAAKRNINILVAHVPGKVNTDADLLSRFQIRQFLDRNPSAHSEPVPLCPEIWDTPGYT